MGNYLSTASLWGERSIPQLRMEPQHPRPVARPRTSSTARPSPASNQFLAIPGNLEQQATWEFDLAICELEADGPTDAAKHFTNGLTLEPDLPMRPIAAYYLEKLGKPVPQARESAGGKAPVEGSRQGDGIRPGNRFQAADSAGAFARWGHAAGCEGGRGAAIRFLQGRNPREGRQGPGAPEETRGAEARSSLSHRSTLAFFRGSASVGRVRTVVGLGISTTCQAE